MKCLILAAGYATRLYPLTENFPKPLLQVQGKTILDWLIDDIDQSGLIDEYVVISNHKFAHHFEQWAAGRVQNIRILDDGTSTNETRLGAVRDIQLAVEGTTGEHGYLVIAGDNVLDFSLRHFIQYCQDHGTSCVMRFCEPDAQRLTKCGVLEVGTDDRILGMEEKPAIPRSQWVCPPFYYYTQQDIQRIPQAIADGCGTDAPGSLVAWLCQQTAVYAMEMPGKRYDIGNLQTYELVQSQYPGIIK